LTLLLLWQLHHLHPPTAPVTSLITLTMLCQLSLESTSL
jgi:hypothetical protein